MFATIEKASKSSNDSWILTVSIGILALRYGPFSSPVMAFLKLESLLSGMGDFVVFDIMESPEIVVIDIMVI